MRGRPPKKPLTSEQARAAARFVEGAEAPDSGSGREPQAAQPPGTAPPVTARPTGVDRAGGLRPWSADFVREDVTKGYALRLPEPLYLKLKWVADQTGRSMNTVIREAVEADVAAYLAREPDQQERSVRTTTS